MHFAVPSDAESALLTTTNLWFSLLDSGYSIYAIFFDLQKAFDSVPHEPLLDILSKYNLPSHITRWFRSYLTCRSQYVVVDGSVSSKRMVTSGVPQGSILGPLLFILYLNDISTLPFPSSISLTLYAEDILLSYPSSDFSLAQGSIDLLSSWLKSRYLTINISKTKYMIISRKSSSFLSLLPSLLLDNSLVECVSNIKYLGVILTSQLSWTPHIDHICSKSKKLLGLLFRQFYSLCSPHVLLKLYLSLVLPHLTVLLFGTLILTVILKSSRVFNSLLLNFVQSNGIVITNLYYSLFTYLLFSAVTDLPNLPVDYYTYKCSHFSDSEV